MWYVVWWEHKTHDGVWLSCSPSIRSNWKYQIINMILHAWIIREMVGVIPRYCPAASCHVTCPDLTPGRGWGGDVEDGGPDVERDSVWSQCDVWAARSVLWLWSHSRGETWDKSSLALRLAGHRQCPPDQFSAVWVAGREGLYLYNNINNNNTRLLILDLYSIVP